MKVTNDVLRELIEIKALIKPLEARVKEIEDACKERGTFITNEFAVVVSATQRIGMASLKKCEEILGREKLMIMGLMSVTQYKSLKISKRVFLDKMLDTQK